MKEFRRIPRGMLTGTGDNLHPVLTDRLQGRPSDAGMGPILLNGIRSDRRCR